MKVIDIYNFIDKIAPFRNALDFDNVGVLVGDKEKTVKTVLIALDITDDVIDEAVNLGAELIISHHPVIFRPLRNMDTESMPYRLAKYGIAAIGAHTNLDLCPTEGVNIALGKRLELSEIKGELSENDGYILYSGVLNKPMKPVDFLSYVKTCLGVSSVRGYAGDREVTKVFFCSGSGGEYIEQAIGLGADAFVTGETRYHEEIYAAKYNMTTVSAGHYETEKPFANLLLTYLKANCGNVEFVISKDEKPPFGIY